MNEPSSAGEDLDALAESFLARLRRGERPSLSEFAARRPDLADEVLELFPALAGMEDLKQAAESSARPTPGVGPGPAVGLLERLGDYKIERLIGSGGMGVVYEAERESLQARVALKVLHPRYRDDDGYRRRFRNEARSAARLHHSNIVPVFDFGEHEGTLYYAMQFIPGVGVDRVLGEVRRLRGPEAGPPTLAAVGPAPTIAEGLLTGRYPGEADPEPGDAPAEAGRPDGPSGTADEASLTLSRISSLGVAGQVCYHREVARIGAEVAEALAHAHGRGVLHRDVKPSNLLLDARGTAWVTDFGLAKFEGGEDLTETGDVVGTLRYMAPERFDGRSDARCDVYSLGATLYEMLALRPAFAEPNRARLVRSLLNDTPRPLRRFDPRVSRDLETVILKAIARSPSDRYATAAELAAELRRVEANRPIRARRVPPWEQYWRWCRRNPAVASLTAVAAALTVAVAAVSTTAAVLQRWSNGEIKQQLRRVEAADRGRSEQLWAAKLAEARAHRSSRKPGQRFEALAALGRAAALSRELGHPPDRFERLRDEAIAALALPDAQLTDAVDVPDPTGLTDVDALFRRYAVCDRRGRASVRRVADGALVAALPDAPPPRKLAFGPGDYLADRDAAGGFRVWDLAKPGAPLVSVSVRGQSWDFAPDGRRLAVALSGGEVSVYDLPSGRRAAALPPGLARLEPSVRLHPLSPLVAVTSHASGPAFELRDTSTGRTLEVPLPWASGGPFTACWSADGRRLAVPRDLAERVALFEVDPEGPQVRPARTIGGGLIDAGMSLAFNPAGDRLLGGNGWSHAAVLCDVESGQALLRFPAHHYKALAVPLRYGADGRVAPGAVDPETSKYRVWSVAEGRECRLLAPRARDGVSGAVAVSPDSRFLVVPGSGGWLTAFDLATGREIGQTRLPDPGSHAFARFDGAGRLVTNGFAGCYRWPVRPDPDDPGGLVFGPPERLPFHPGNEFVAASRDGATVVQAMVGTAGMGDYRGGWIFRESEPGNPLRVAYGRSTALASVSPDGRWAGFASDNGSVVYEAKSGRPEWAASEPGTRFAFSPVGDRMAAGAEATRVYAVGTWEPGAALGPGSPVGFTADGQLALLECTDRTLRLVDAADGRTLGRFEDPEPEEVTPFLAAITADGSWIVMPHRKGVRLWDVRRLRSELARLGLDWDAPPLPPATAPAGPSRVRFVGEAHVEPRLRAAAEFVSGLAAPYAAPRPDARAHLAHARSLARLGLAGPATRHLGRALALDPGMAEAAAERGLLRYAGGDPEGAAADFGRAIGAGPPDPGLEFRRAWALREMGKLGEAAAGLKAAVELRSPAGPHRPALLTLRAAVLAEAGRGEDARADEASALAGSPDLAPELNGEAWRLLTGRPERRVATAALALARRATELAPDRHNLNTLGLALLRAGRPAEARDLLRSRPAAGASARDAYDLFVLAMAHRQLGEAAEARSAFDRASRWRDGADALPAVEREELAGFESEARLAVGPGL